MTVAEVIAQTLKKLDVEIVFGLPGGENVPLMAAIDRAGIRFVLMHHESRAAWAADAYSRIGRRVGVCLSTLGPGAVNLAAGLGHCFLDRSPVIAMTAQLPEQLMEGHSHQRLDLLSVFAPVTKASFVVNNCANVANLVQKAVKTAQTGRLGPVHIQISSQVSNEDTVNDYEDGYGKCAAIYPVSDEAIDAAISLLKSAKQPAILAGLAVEPTAPYTLLHHLAESLKAAVVVTPKAKGSIPESHPLFAGVLGLERREHPAEVLHNADLILGVGFDPVELMVPWNFTARYIHVANSPNTDPELPAELALVGDLTSTLTRLLRQSSASWVYNRVSWHAPFQHTGNGHWPPAIAGAGFMPSKLIRTAREILPDRGIAVVDVGSHKLLISKLWPAIQPNKFLVSNGISTMGYAVPAAIGAKLARPDLPVICFTGDGGLGMVDSTLETAVRLKLPIVVIVLADKAMSLIRLKQISSGYKTVGTLMGPIDWVSIARGFGADGISVSNNRSFRRVLSQAMAAKGPVLIEARIDAGEYQSF